MLTRSVAIAVALVLVAGCRASAPRLEEDPELKAMKAARAARPADAPERVRLAVAPLAREGAPEAARPAKAEKAGRGRAVVHATRLDAAIRDAVATYAGCEPVAVEADLVKGFAAARAAGRDILMQPVVTALDAEWKGRNLVWLPSFAVWAFFWFPSFWVADEDFGLAGELELRFYSTASEHMIYAKKVPIDIRSALDDFERGWSLTGVLTFPYTIDKSNWAAVSRALYPHLEAQVAKAAAVEVGTNLVAFLDSLERPIPPQAAKPLPASLKGDAFESLGGFRPPSAVRR